MAWLRSLSATIRSKMRRCASRRSRGVDDLRREIERVVVDEDRAEDRALGFEVVRKRTLRSSYDSVGHEDCAEE